MPRQYKRSVTRSGGSPLSYLTEGDFRGEQAVGFSRAINMANEDQRNRMEMSGLQREEWRDAAKFEQEQETYRWNAENGALSRKFISELDADDPDLDEKLSSMDSRIYGVPGVDKQLNALWKTQAARGRTRAKALAVKERKDHYIRREADGFDAGVGLAVNSAIDAGDYDAVDELMLGGRAKIQKREEDEKAMIAFYKREQYNRSEEGVATADLVRRQQVYDDETKKLEKLDKDYGKENRNFKKGNKKPILEQAANKKALKAHLAKGRPTAGGKKKKENKASGDVKRFIDGI